MDLVPVYWTGEGLKKQIYDVLFISGTVSDVGTRDVMDVAFSVSLSKHLHMLGTGQTIKFDDVITNLGSGYCPVTGVFTCPVDGIYVFVATIMCHSGKCNELQLMMDGVRKMLVYTAGHSHPNQSSNSVVLQLKESDRLWIETHGYPSPSSVYGGNWSSFTGVKIK